MATRSTKTRREKDNGPKKMGGEFRSGPIAGTALVSGATFTNKGLQYAEIEGLAGIVGSARTVGQESRFALGTEVPTATSQKDDLTVYIKVARTSTGKQTSTRA